VVLLPDFCPRTPSSAPIPIHTEMSEANPSPASSPDAEPPRDSTPGAPSTAPTVDEKPKDPGHTAAEEVLDPISSELMKLLPLANGEALTVQQIAEHLKERGWALLTLFLAAPFPIPNIPFLSVPFGLAIAFIGWGFMMRRKPWLPNFVMKTKLEYTTLQKVLPFISRMMARFERWTKPRQRWIVSGPSMPSLIGLSIVSGGFFLALPLPIPFTNGPPALSIIFLVVGMLCRDGIIVMIGHILGLLSWIYLGIWIYVLRAVLWPYLIHGWDWIKNLF